MPLSDGDEAPDGDVWFRIVTQKDHIVRGRVHHGAFGGNAISAPKSQRPWSRELSGRLRSLAGTLEDLRLVAEAYCAEQSAKGQGKKEFVGVFYVRARDAKLTFENIASSVRFTPRDGDAAHADFTVHPWIGPTKEDRERFNIWLTDVLQALHHPGQLHHLPDAE